MPCALSPMLLAVIIEGLKNGFNPIKPSKSNEPEPLHLDAGGRRC